VPSKLHLALALGASAALAGGAGAALASSGAGPDAHAAATQTVRLKAAKTGFRFSTSRITVRRGSVRLRMANPSSAAHAIAVKGHGVRKAGAVVAQGDTSTVTVRLRKGTYTFFCPLPGHEQAGMKGTLVVR
jgi:plastocyanin